MTHKFIIKNGFLSWSEIIYLIDKDLIKPEVCIHLAIDQSKGSSEPLLVELACLNSNDSVLPIVKDLAKTQCEKIDETKILKLLLKWLYENREKLDDPLGELEKVYADFNYPSSISHLIRYMPTDAPDLGSTELNEARIISEWGKFCSG